jgi:NADPH-dependent 2,4-dienoyl-CoA reductase/sulfur reductase-like enzyme/rhodanese-related sulfurtransferase
MKVIIIGGMAAGPKTAARLRRLRPDAEITIVEQGELISFGSCGIPFYLGNLVPQFESLYATSYGVARNAEFFGSRKEIKVLTGTKALKVDRSRKRITVIKLDNNEQFELEYDYLVITTGAEAVSPSITGLNLPGVFTLHDPGGARSLYNYLRERKARHVTVIGAGVIGMEVADALRGRRLNITVCEAQHQILPKLLDIDIARLVAAQMKKRKIDLQLDCRVKSVNAGEDGKVSQVITANGEIYTDAVVIAAGVRPRIGLAQNTGLEIGTTGAIKVDSHLRTSDPFIFAAGDCASQINSISGREVYIPLASTANKQGRVVANNIAGLNTEFNGVMGTTVLQAFDFNIGRTGLGEQEAKSLGYNVISGITAGHDAPHYYPLHGSVIMKLIADRDYGRLLGAQVCGAGDGIKRLDVLGTAIKFNISLQDISNLDLGYAPPYAEAIDLAIHAVNMLDNKRSGVARGLSPLAVEDLKNTGVEVCFLDIREPDEIRAVPLQEKTALLIPGGELRDRYREIPKDKLVVVVCGLGIRSYEAVCFLQNMGFKKVAYLEGGISTWLQ